MNINIKSLYTLTFHGYVHGVSHTIHIIHYDYISYTYILDLQLALFSAQSSFCSLELENVHLNLDGQVFTLVARDNTLTSFASKCIKCKNAKSGEITLMWRKTAQRAKASQIHVHLFVLFRGCKCRYVCTNDYQCKV